MKSTTRFEFKYILNPAQAHVARDIVAQLMDADPAAGAPGWYTVTSLYFDTPQLGDYYDKSGGFLERKKLRARIYADHWDGQSPIWIEVKKKRDMAFQKTRALLSPEEWQELCNHSYATLLARARPTKDQIALEEFVWYTLQEGRRPTAYVRYKRTPFLREDDETLRITFDEDIRCARANNLSPQPFADRITEQIIMEVKFAARLPAWFHSMIKKLDIRRESFSKYGHSIDTFYRHNPLPH
ncbi:MAG: hypothetical protein A2756_00430 [Candidatus Ryanbacteria bacterium RIFCSPHIGHO2_01_FULL_48_27]|uniref:VTC domain-containing protein n=1 Tax=Candidatus Ryanbacteria bacterium RIFCSPHIGHO2_01_FULL_48_27 TaxID=1802115 RepID=A0A1G2G673_9BACT|nr:MAG: hypothetical protein A2756_00430 [Candidatus Ryanbacteria bacterium RIFCSPHIGHO2_01_FULL_48_27]